jgi:hypothetical protein
VINSLKHAFGNAMQGGSIVLTYTAVETEWSLSVSDNGSGKRERVSNHEGGLGIRHYRGSHPPTECAGRDRKWSPKAPLFRLLIAWPKRFSSSCTARTRSRLILASARATSAIRFRDSHFRSEKSGQLLGTNVAGVTW